MSRLSSKRLAQNRSKVPTLPVVPYLFFFYNSLFDRRSDLNDKIGPTPKTFLSEIVRLIVRSAKKCGDLWRTSNKDWPLDRRCGASSVYQKLVIPPLLRKYQYLYNCSFVLSQHGSAGRRRQKD